jgi:hypothetical protein
MEQRVSDSRLFEVATTLSLLQVEKGASQVVYVLRFYKSLGIYIYLYQTPFSPTRARKTFKRPRRNESDLCTGHLHKP